MKQPYRLRVWNNGKLFSSETKLVENEAFMANLYQERSTSIWSYANVQVSLTLPTFMSNTSPETELQNTSTIWRTHTSLVSIMWLVLRIVMRLPRKTNSVVKIYLSKAKKNWRFLHLVLLYKITCLPYRLSNLWFAVFHLLTNWIFL